MAKSKTVSKPNPKAPLSTSDIQYLSAAISDARGWRGNKMPEDWPEFDKHIRYMELAKKRAAHAREMLRWIQHVLDSDYTDAGMLATIKKVMESYK